MDRKTVKLLAQSRDCSCIKGKDRDTNFNSIIDEVFEWHYSEVQKIRNEKIDKIIK